MATLPNMAQTRPPAVAGQFYPGHAERLKREVESLLGATEPSESWMPKALIAPHAGYIYSGAVAAAAFSRLRSRPDQIRRVVVIGPAHYVGFNGIALPTVNAFATPLGPIPLAGAKQLAGLPFIVLDDAPHAPEHAIEVELPFLQCVLGSFELIPLVIGNVEPGAVATTLNRLWGGPETLIVVSSDLSHFNDYQTARDLDIATAENIEAKRWFALGPNDACGYLAVAGLLIEAERRMLDARRLALCNSGDTAGPPERVVGYGAWSW